MAQFPECDFQRTGVNSLNFQTGIHADMKSKKIFLSDPSALLCSILYCFCMGSALTPWHKHSDGC